MGKRSVGSLVRPHAHIDQYWARRNAQRAHSQGYQPRAFVRVAIHREQYPSTVSVQDLTDVLFIVPANRHHPYAFVTVRKSVTVTLKDLI
jgi:hypothetical protein